MSTQFDLVGLWNSSVRRSDDLVLDIEHCGGLRPFHFLWVRPLSGGLSEPLAVARVFKVLDEGVLLVKRTVSNAEY